jgi:hypothetical protein
MQRIDAITTEKRQHRDKRRRVSLKTLTILLFNVWKSVRNKHLGWNDADLSLERFYRDFHCEIDISDDLIEKALYCCQMNEECSGGYWHPQGKKWIHFLKEVLGKDEYNSDYCWIEKDTDG